MDTQDRTGQVIAGKYRVTQQLGHGAFGYVWLCEQTDIGRKVVIKVLHSQWARVPSVVERFRREAMATDRIHQGNICKVYDYAMTEDGIPYIAMEYLEGGTVKDELKRSGRMSITRVAELMAPVCDAVAAAHAAGIIHRDLKLENVMLTRRDGLHDVPIVLDFGIAKFLDAAEKLTQTGSLMGTPTYMSPEQCRGQADIGPAADVYSLGVMSYELLVGQPPFTARTVAELAMKHVLDPAPPLTGAPAPLAKVVAATMAKEPGARPPAAALATALREAAKQPSASRPQPVLVPPPTLMSAHKSPEAATVMSTGQGAEIDRMARHRLAQGAAPAKKPFPVALAAAVVVGLAVLGGVLAFFLR